MEKAIRWIIFTVILSLSPLVVDFIAEATRMHGAVTANNFGRHGELYLLASTMCVVGVGEIIGSNEKARVLKLIGGGAALLMIGVAIALYTITASDAALELQREAEAKRTIVESFSNTIISYSWIAFLFSSVISTSCVIISGVE